VVFPLFKQRLFDRPLRFHIDNVDNDTLSLQKPVTAVYSLDKIIELIINAQEYLSVAMLLEIAPAAAQ
jgi:hypothetical protein